MVNTTAPILSDFAVENAYRFLKTVVVIDDKANLKSRPPSAEGDSSPQIDDEHGRSEERMPGTLVTPEDDSAGDSSDPEELYAKVLADSFADKGIACATFRPDNDEDVSTRIYKVAESADILILDWILGLSDDGGMAISLILKILDGENDSPRLRLISIYTGESDLGMVAGKILEGLSNHCADATDRLSHFAMQIGHARVVIYGKENTRVPQEDSELAERFVDAAVLPERLVRDFADMTQGILPGVAIVGLSEVRAQTHKLLTMFSTSLDSAYLGHRMLLDNPSEAEEQVVLTLASELHSILEDGNVAEQAGIKAIRAWIQERNSENALRMNLLTQTPSGQPATIDTVLRVLKDGNKYIDDPRLQLRSWKWERSTHAFESSDDLANDSDRRFARMMHVKTRYGIPPPILTLGTILFSESDDGGTYWLCLQPRCDSVRIKDQRAFPMMPLSLTDGSRNEFDIVVNHRNCWRLLKVGSQPYELQMFTFGVDESQSDVIKATKCGDVWEINSGGNPSYEWVDELKDEHAQRILNKFAAEFSRVGVNESEWVRRSGSSGN